MAASGQRIVRAHRIFQTEVRVSGANRHSTAVAALTEVAPDSGGDVPFVAGATMKVYNVAPQDSGVVVVRGEVDWDTDLNVRVSVIIF
jgi:hypothetical protein